MYHVITNRSNFITDATEKILKKWSVEYTKEMLKEGYKLNEVMFCWAPCNFRHHAMKRPWKG